MDDSSKPQPSTLRRRLDALRNLPSVARLIFQAARMHVLALVALRVLAAFLPIATLFVSQHLIDLVVAASRTGGHADRAAVVRLLLIGFSLAGSSLVLNRAIDYFEARLADIFSRDVSLRIMQHAASLDLASFEDPAFADRLDRARAQATDRVAFVTSTGSVIQRIVSVVSLAATVTYYSHWLFLVLLVCLVPAFLGESRFAFLGYQLAHRLTPLRRELDYLLLLGSSRDSAKEVRMFGLADHLRKRYESRSSEVLSANRNLMRRRLAWGLVMAVAGLGGYYGSYAFIVWRAVDGAITVGTLTLLAGAVGSAYSELQTLFALFSALSEQALFLTDLVVFFRARPTIASPPEALVAPRPIRHGIEFENVSFNYPGGPPVLRDLRLTIRPGEHIAVVAENGRGKSTLVKLLGRLYEPVAGRILLDGVDLREYRLEDLRKEMSFIFQDFFRYDMSVRDNISAGRIELASNDQALWDAVARAGADRAVQQLPGRLDQMLGRRFEGGVDLSGGQWQTLALARACLGDAQMLVLDEPTSALDPIAEASVFDHFSHVIDGRTAVVISHRFSTVRLADRSVVLDDGHIIEDGTHASLVACRGRYATLFEAQASSYR